LEMRVREKNKKEVSDFDGLKGWLYW
jgi:hypothetical protein